MSLLIFVVCVHVSIYESVCAYVRACLCVRFCVCVCGFMGGEINLTALEMRSSDKYTWGINK